MTIYIQQVRVYATSSKHTCPQLWHLYTCDHEIPQRSRVIISRKRGHVNGRTDGRTDIWMDGRTDIWMDDWKTLVL